MAKVTCEMTISEVLEVLKNNNVINVDNSELWYDWFCKEHALHNRGITLLRKLKSIKDSKKFDKDKTYVWFKNNCPVFGGLYDDFRIADKETGNVLYTIIPKNNEYEEAEVWGYENNFEHAILKGT